MRHALLIIVFALLSGLPAHAYPEFQVWIAKQTPRHVNCAMCHAHGDGPDGMKPGQIGSLDPAQLTALNEARQAFKPGQSVSSPVLNAFGNRIIERLGRTEFIALRTRPIDFPKTYGLESDIDGDGIADAQEYLDGTLPTNAHHGAPWALLRHNAQLNWWHIALMILATGFGLYGINNLLAWFALIAGDVEQASEDQAPGPDADASYDRDLPVSRGGRPR